jgi:uncharacterized membrane protein YphA (DoxX/SURF4 family)
MRSVAVVVRVVLGGVMVAAGIGKLSNRSWPAQARALGAPAIAVPVVAPLELALGAALVVGVFPRLAGTAVAALLAAFTVLLAVRLREGLHPPCACFGGRRPRPIDGWSVARNGLLIAAALVPAIGG